MTPQGIESYLFARQSVKLTLFHSSGQNSMINIPERLQDRTIPIVLVSRLADHVYIQMEVHCDAENDLINGCYVNPACCGIYYENYVFRPRSYYLDLHILICGILLIIKPLIFLIIISRLHYFKCKNFSLLNNPLAYSPIFCNIQVYLSLSFPTDR